MILNPASALMIGHTSSHNVLKCWYSRHFQSFPSGSHMFFVPFPQQHGPGTENCEGKPWLQQLGFDAGVSQTLSHVLWYCPTFFHPPGPCKVKWRYQSSIWSTHQHLQADQVLDWQFKSTLHGLRGKPEKAEVISHDMWSAPAYPYLQPVTRESFTICCG